MSEDHNVAKSAGGPPSSGWSAQAVMAIINGVLVGVGTLYLATKSTAIATIGAIVAAALAGLYLLLSRRP
jgi:hypothetical protein